MDVYDVLIIGGGPAGASAALYTARAELDTLVIDKGAGAGALGMAGKIANYPGLTEEISGIELLERMRNQARSFGAEFVNDKVIASELLTQTKKVFGNRDTYLGRSVIIASGSMGRGATIKGESEFIGRGVSYCATCDAPFFKNQEVLVAGDSDEAIEEALYLTRFVSRVHFFSPSEHLKAPQELIGLLESNPKVSLYRAARLKEIAGNGKVDSARIEVQGKGEQTIPIGGAFIYLQGGKPITDFLVGQVELSEKGCLLVDRDLSTSAPGVYGAGDVLCGHIRQVVISAGEGALAGIAVEKALRGRRQVVVDWAE